MALERHLSEIVEAARSKKAFRIRLIEVKGHCSFTDAFAFMSGGSDRQNRAIADAIEERLKEELGLRVISTEGADTGNWILLDFGEVVVHVMDEDTRRHYDLEGLWASGTELEIPESSDTPFGGLAAR